MKDGRAKDIEDARAYSDARRYLIERAEKRLARAFEDTNREPMTMLALLNAAWEMCARHQYSNETRHIAMKHIFMNAVGKLSGAIVQEAVVEDVAGPIPEEAWTDTDQSLAEKFAPKGGDDGSVH